MSESSPDPGMADGAARERYHHGDLRAALVRAAEAILTERGVEGFTLREAARRAGVSPAAPAHHFGSAAGLLTEVAVLGFEALTRYLREGTESGGADPAARLRGQGVGYVRFALAYPARFQLMFRRDRLLPDERLAAAGHAAFAELERAVRAAGPAGSDRPADSLLPDGPLPDGLSDAAADRALQAALVGAWSAVHGFAHLALEGRLDDCAGPGGLEALAADMLDGLFASPPGGNRAGPAP